MAVTITSVLFHNFKAFANFSLPLSSMNVLVGPNNCGKSTIISAFRALEAGLRTALSRSAQKLDGPGGPILGHPISAESLPLSLENVHTNYSEEPSSVRFLLSNGGALMLLFPTDGGCVLIPEASGRHIRTPKEFRSTFPVSVSVVPVLGPLEHDEEYVQEETVRRGLPTHRASRHFRNFWRVNKNTFASFAELVSRTWPGMELMPPEIVPGTPMRIAMFCKEHGISRELYWSGFGFQIWCQLLTHISRARDATLLVVDEPEIYLHPDVQRQLLGVLRDQAAAVVVATHSTEIIADSDVDEIVDIDKSRTAARRLRDDAAVQSVLETIGSVHNITLTRLARHRRVLFVEGLEDFRRLRLFAANLGLRNAASGLSVTAVESGGFSSWQQVRTLASNLEKTLGVRLQIAAVYDRDYWCDEEIAGAREQLGDVVTLAHFHGRKELENYMLNADALSRIIRNSSSEGSVDVEQMLDSVTNPMRDELVSQYLAKRADYLVRRTDRDSSTLNKETLAWFSERWNSPHRRLEVVSGKAVLSEVRRVAKTNWNVSLTDSKIIKGLHRAEIPSDLVECLKAIESFCTAPIPTR